MGNCQAAEAATVIIHHPAGNKVERIYSPVAARCVMNSNPDHFVALVVNPPPAAATTANGVAVKHLKLLRPDDNLLLGQVYRLVSVQDVIKEFAAKKCVKLAKLLEGGGIVIDKNKLHNCSGLNTNQRPENRSLGKEEQRQAHRRGSSSSGGSSNSGRGMGKNQSSGGQWRPALQSISELGT